MEVRVLSSASLTASRAASVLSRFTYTLDAIGNPTALSGTETGTYAYDLLDRLTEVCFQAGCPNSSDPYIRWAYDAVGNRTSETRPAGQTTYSYNDADQLTSKTGPSGTVSYGFDTNGNQTAAGSRSFAYDLANRTKSTTEGSTTITYSYDGDGTRLQASGGGETTNYLWDSNHALPQLALERDGAGAQLRSYLYGSHRVSMDTGGSSFYYHHDGIGSVANVSSSTGVSQSTYAHEPFGEARTTTKNDPAAPDNVMRFTGELFDSATGLYHLRARQYDPVNGRFLATDPLPPLVTDPYVSTYVYATNRPTALVDPSGMGPVWSQDAQACPWPVQLRWIGDEFCGGFLSMSPTAQGIIGGYLEASGRLLGAIASVRSGGRSRLNPDPRAQGPHSVSDEIHRLEK